MFTYDYNSKVPSNSVIAKIYDNPQDVSKAYKIDYLDNKLNLINNFQNKLKSQDEIFLINEKINSSIQELIYRCYIDKDFQNNLEKIWFYLNAKNIYSGKTDDLNIKIKSIIEEKNSISTPKENVVLYSPSDGIFLRNIDGLENTLDYNSTNFNIKDITSKKKDSNNIGKLIKINKWYGFFEISDFEVDKIKKSKNMFISVLDISHIKNIPCKLESLEFNEITKKYNLKISCDYMNKYFYYLRKENFCITVENYTGIKIPKVALRANDENKFGVYVVRGRYCEFKNINIIFSEKDFVICEYNPNFYSDENYIQEGDKIIIKGINLYNGKKIK